MSIAESIIKICEASADSCEASFYALRAFLWSFNRPQTPTGWQYISISRARTNPPLTGALAVRTCLVPKKNPTGIFLIVSVTSWPPQENVFIWPPFFQYNKSLLRQKTGGACLYMPLDGHWLASFEVIPPPPKLVFPRPKNENSPLKTVFLIHFCF